MSTVYRQVELRRYDGRPEVVWIPRQYAHEGADLIVSPRKGTKFTATVAKVFPGVELDEDTLCQVESSS